MNWKDPDSPNLTDASLRQLLEYTTALQPAANGQSGPATESLLLDLLGRSWSQPGSAGQPTSDADASDSKSGSSGGSMTGGSTGELESLLAPVYRAAAGLTPENAAPTDQYGSSAESLLGLFSNVWGSGLESLLGPIYQVITSLSRQSTPVAATPIRVADPLGRPAIDNWGLAGDSLLTGADYADNGLPRASSAAAPQIVVQVQAIDSSSFLDRSGDIAAALRRAMLETPGLQNEVVD